MLDDTTIQRVVNTYCTFTNLKLCTKMSIEMKTDDATKIVTAHVCLLGNDGECYWYLLLNCYPSINDPDLYKCHISGSYLENGVYNDPKVIIAKYTGHTQDDVMDISCLNELDMYEKLIHYYCDRMNIRIGSMSVHINDTHDKINAYITNNKSRYNINISIVATRDDTITKCLFRLVAIQEDPRMYNDEWFNNKNFEIYIKNPMCDYGENYDNIMHKLDEIRKYIYLNQDDICVAGIAKIRSKLSTIVNSLNKPREDNPKL